MARTDAHRPSAIVATEYEFVACDYYGGGLDASREMGYERQAFRAHMEKSGGTFAEQRNEGTCYVCGARALYVAKFHHTPSNTYIVTGMDCARKLEIGDEHAFASFRKKIKAGLEAHAGKAKAQRILGDLGLAAAWAHFESTDEAYEPRIIRDIVSKVVKYGSISDGQVAFVGKLLEQFTAKTAKRAAEAANSAPVPASDKRIEVTGTIVSTRTQDHAVYSFGTVTKMLVRHETGYKVWGTMPSELCAKRGDVVSFTARIERSEKDETFGFFSRPTKARIVTKAPEAESTAA